MTRSNVFIVALTLVLGLACSTAMAQTVPFKKGEVIRYSVKQAGIKAGEATLTFEGETYRDGKKYTLIVFSAKGFNFFDEERIFIDDTTFLPQLVIRDLNIFGNKEKIMEEYNNAAGLITVTKDADGHVSVQTIKKEGQVDNIYGFIYRYRASGRAAQDAKFALRLPTLDVTIAPVAGMKFNAMGQVFDAELMRSVPSKYSIWMDTSDKRLPLRIAGAIGIANTVMTIIDYKE